MGVNFNLARKITFFSKANAEIWFSFLSELHVEADINKTAANSKTQQKSG